MTKLLFAWVAFSLFTGTPCHADEVDDLLAELAKKIHENAPVEELDELSRKITGTSISPPRLGWRIQRSPEEDQRYFLTLIDGLKHFDAQVRETVFEVLEQQA